MKFSIVCGACLAAMCIASNSIAIPPLHATDACVGINCDHGNCGNGKCVTGACQHLPPNLVAPGRPSPPPCCADGISISNPQTWGFYETRWRRWSVEYAETGPGGTTTPAPIPEIRLYETPPAEEEDLKAPAPTTPKEDQVPVGQQPDAQQAAPQSLDGVPLPDAEAPGTGAGPTDGGSLLRGLPPYEPQSPGMRSPDAAPSQSPGAQPGTTPQSPATRPLSTGIPTSDLDPPPALPIGARSIKINERPIQWEARTPARTAPQQPSRIQQQSPSNDPPPALPTTLASLAG